MNDETITLERTDEDILTYTVSDDALEAAAGFVAGNEPSLGGCDYTHVTELHCWGHCW
jgi:hypothetical protein